MRELIPYFLDVIRILREIDHECIFVNGPVALERDNQLGSLSFRLRYADESELTVALTADCADEYPIWPAYSFHYQRGAEGFRFRYDNAPHHAGLPNFPHHLHVGPNPATILPYGPPSPRTVASAIRWYLDNPGGHWHPDMHGLRPGV